MALEKTSVKKATSGKPVSALNQDITWIKETLLVMSIQQKTTEDTLILLNNSVIGNKSYGQKGMVNRLEDVEEYIVADKGFKSKAIGVGLALGVAWTFVLKFWDKIF